MQTHYAGHFQKLPLNRKLCAANLKKSSIIIGNNVAVYTCSTDTEKVVSHVDGRYLLENLS